MACSDGCPAAPAQSVQEGGVGIWRPEVYVHEGPGVVRSNDVGSSAGA